MCTERTLRQKIIHEFKDAVNCTQNIVYFAHRFGGDPKNIRRVEQYVMLYKQKHPKAMTLSPLNEMGFLYGYITEEQANRDCLSWLTLCNKMIVCGDYPETSFVNAEIKFAEENGIPIVYMEEL